MFDFSLIDNINRIIREGARDRMNELEFMEKEISFFLGSPERRLMIDGGRYYKGEQDILRKQRTAIGEDGKPVVIHNIPNSRLEDNQYRKMVIQKTNYLVGKPITFRSDDAAYAKALKKVFNKAFAKKIKTVAKHSLNEGICWIYLTYGENGKLKFRVFPGYEVCPGWKDAEHSELEYAYRIYPIRLYEGKNQERILWKIEVYTENGIDYFESPTAGINLTPCEPYHQDYLTISDEDGNDTGYNWSRIPLVPFKYNDDELPLIKAAKSLQDAINTILSNFSDNMQEDPRNTILVLVNYDGQNLGEFRQNLATYGAVKVTSDSSGSGDVRTLNVEVNSENYKSIIEVLKKAMIENCMGYDAKDDRLGGSPNQMNIQSMYNDIDLDANNMETEFQASFEQLLWFVNAHLSNIGAGDYTGEDVEVIFNRDMMMNETDVINNIRNSEGVLSDETLIAQHPWVTDPQAEMKRLEKQKQENMEQYGFYDDLHQRAAGGDPEGDPEGRDGSRPGKEDKSGVKDGKQ